jgi:hypothetical protein
VSTQYNRETSWLPGAYDVLERARLPLQYVTIEKDEGVERLILRRGAHVMLDGERGEKFGDAVLALVGGMMVFEKEKKPLDPMYIGVFSADAVVAEADRGPDMVK